MLNSEYMQRDSQLYKKNITNNTHTQISLLELQILLEMCQLQPERACVFLRHAVMAVLVCGTHWRNGAE